MRGVLRAGVIALLIAACGSSGNGGQSSSSTSGPKFEKNLSITAVAMFQATKVDLVKTDGDGKTAHVDAPTAPVVNDRPGQLRVYVSRGDSYQPHDVTAELHVSGADGKELFVVTDTKTIDADSSDGNTDSTFNFVLETDQTIPAGAQYRVALLDPDKGIALDKSKQSTALAARWPQDGTLDTFGTMEMGDSIKVVVVPLKYDADGSGRLPDTSDKQMQAFKDRLMQLYPVKKVDFTIRAPWSWSSPRLEPGDQNAWGQLLLDTSSLRTTDKAAKDVFYFVLFNSYSSWLSYLAAGTNGAIIGVGDGRDAKNPLYHNVAVVGYTGVFQQQGIKISGFDTLPQELAHTLGRLHAPCSPPGQPLPFPLDNKYPYKNGQIGAWGYDILGHRFIDPSTNVREYMSYCFDAIWTSDYTYNLMAQQLSAIYAPKTAREVPPIAAPQRYRQVLIGTDGQLIPRGTVMLDTPPEGEAREVTLKSVDGHVVSTVTGQVMPLGRLDVRALLYPETASYATAHVSGLGQLRITPNDDATR